MIERKFIDVNGAYGVLSGIKSTGGNGFRDGSSFRIVIRYFLEFF